MTKLDQPHFDVDVSRTYKNKDGYTAGAYRLNWSFITERHTPQTFLETVIRQGWPYTMAHQKRHPKDTGAAAARGVLTPKHTENFISQQVLTLDDDSKRPGVIDAWLTDPFFSRWGWAFVESVNSQPGAEKGHPTLIFDRPITDPGLYKDCLLAAIAYWPQIDPLKNIDRTIYNADQATVHLLGHICPFDVFERDILRPFQAERNAALAHAEAEAERRREAWAASDQAEPVNGQIGRYVAAAVSGVLTAIANTKEGGARGETRHKMLYNGAARLESLALADWLDADGRRAIAGYVSDLVSAASKNGYEKKYGELEVERIIRDGRGIATAAVEPDWKIYDQAATSDQPPEPEQPPETAVTVPVGRYLADILAPADLPDRCILDAQTGIGKTTWAATRLTEDSFPIIAFSSTVALEQQMARYPDFGAWYELVKNARPDLPGVFTTYESAPTVIKHLAGLGLDLGRVSFVVDECHNFALAGYRNAALGGLVDLTEAHPFKRVILMSGTTLPMFGVMTDYEAVYVGSQQRGQVGQIVKWKRQTDDGDYEGGMLDTAAALASRHTSDGGRVLIHLDDKGKKLHGLIARLEAAGIDQGNIFTLNSDNKYEAVGRQIADYETVPDHCQALIVTSVFVESSNLTTPFDAGILCTRMHPAAAQQFANRQRGAAGMGVIYILHGGTGRGWTFDVDAALTHAEAGGAWLAADLNIKAENGAGATDQARQIYGGEYGRLVKPVGDRWEIDPLGVTQHVHTSLTGYAGNNAEAFKRQLTRWGWAFNPDMQQVVTAADKTEDQLAAEAERRRELQQVAAADYESILSWLAKLDQDQAERFTVGDLPLSAKQRRVLDRAVTLAGLLGYAEAWGDSLGLLATIGDSGQAFNRLCRTVLADNLASDGDRFTQQILASFEPGEALTRAERHGRLTAVYELSPKMRPFVAKMKRYHWSDDETARLDEKSADDVIRMLYTVKPGQQRRDGKVIRVWTIDRARPLPGLLAAGREKLRELLQTDAATHVTAVGAACHTSLHLYKQNEQTSVTPDPETAANQPQLDDQPEPATEPVTLPDSAARRSVLANHILIKERRGLPLSAGLLATKQALVEVGALCQR